jgi:hypothetical protein
MNCSFGNVYARTSCSRRGWSNESWESIDCIARLGVGEEGEMALSVKLVCYPSLLALALVVFCINQKCTRGYSLHS